MVMPIPCSIITGALGTGKTTCIGELIKIKPKAERWAIIVNEFGAVGIDGAILGAPASTGQTAAGVNVRELAGGCMCCTLSGPFSASIAQVIRQTKPDRLIIEPSGLGHPAGLMDVLQGEHLRVAVQVNAILCLVAVGSQRTLEENTSYFDQVNIADVIVGNKSDLASAEQVLDFHSWGRELWPPKAQVLAIERGLLPGGLALLDLPRDPVFQPLFAAAHSSRRRQQRQAPQGQQQRQAPQGQQQPAFLQSEGQGVGLLRGSEAASGMSEVPGAFMLRPGVPVLLIADASQEHLAAGWLFHQEDVFDQQGLQALLGEAAACSSVLRIKGVFRVQARGASKSKWVVLKQQQADLAFDPICYRRESRVELIVQRIPMQHGGGSCGSGGGCSPVEEACRSGRWEVLGELLKRQLLGMNTISAIHSLTDGSLTT